MGDNGRLYSCYSAVMAEKMKELVACADVVVPNLTEAALLLGEEPVLEPTEEQTQQMLHRLGELGPRLTVLTGVRRGGRIGAAIYDRGTGRIGYALADSIDGSFHGTRLFAAVMLAALLRGESPKLRRNRGRVCFAHHRATQEPGNRSSVRRSDSSRCCRN